MQIKLNFKELRKVPIKFKYLLAILKNFKALNKRTQIIIGLIGILMIVGVVFAFTSLGNAPATTQVITGLVQKGDVKKVITATGTANLSQVMPLSFEKGGTVLDILVQEGEVVEEGQPLVQLDTTTLEQELKEATENLASAQASYEQTIGDLARKVKSNLVQAEKSLLNAQKNCDPYYLENQYYLAELNFKIASEKLANAQGAGETDTYQLQVALSQAQLNLIDAKYRRDGGAAKELEVAQRDYDAVLKTARDFENGISNEVLAAKASLTQSETKLLTAQDNLAKATLRAPMAGTIISREIELYQNVGTAAVMSLVADPRDFTVSASVDQADISEIKVGQKVEITLDTALDQVMEGTVSGVSLKGTNTQNVITYNIKIDVDKPSDHLRDKMNVNVSFISQEVKDVLTIPSRALVTQGRITGVYVPKSQAPSGTSSQSPAQSERPSQGQFPAQGERPGQSQSPAQSERPNQGQFPAQGQRPAENVGQFPSGTGSSNFSGMADDYQFVAIETGLNDGLNVEVKSGLSEGQVIVIQMNQQGTAGSNPNAQRPGGFSGVNMGGAGRLLR